MVQLLSGFKDGEDHEGVKTPWQDMFSTITGKRGRLIKLAALSARLGLALYLVTSALARSDHRAMSAWKVACRNYAGRSCAAWHLLHVRPRSFRNGRRTLRSGQSDFVRGDRYA